CKAQDYPKLLSGGGGRRAMSFPPLKEEDGAESPMIIEVEMGGHFVHMSSRVIPMECAIISGPSIPSPAVNQVLEEKINIAIHPEYPEQTVAIGSTLTEKGRKELCSLLKQNLDIFAWKPAEHRGISGRDIRRLGKRKEDRHRKEIRQSKKKWKN
ncbi:hypothetical protein Tco_1129080, partial [Tanacetum coccineum]